MSQEQHPYDAPPRPAEPAPGTAPAGSFAGGTAVASLQSSWAGLGQPERITVAAAAVVAVAYLLGAVVEGWAMTTAALVALVGSIAAIVAVFARASRNTMSASTTLAIRGGAALVGAFAVVDLGNLVSVVGDLGDVPTLTLLLWVASIVAAFVLVWAAWRATAGDAIADGLGLVSSTRALDARLVYLGAAGLALGWAVITVDSIVLFRSDSEIALLCGVLAAIALWAASAGIVRAWPVASAYVVAALAGVTGLLALVWLVRILPDVGNAGVIGILGIVLYVAAVAALVAGAALDARTELARRPAA